jgi:hypothetical protein
VADRRSNTRPATLNEAQVFLARAAQFVEAAQDAAGRENWDATAGNAVPAAIAAADAISSASPSFAPGARSSMGVPI